jgi:hypothetical protein
MRTLKQVNQLTSEKLTLVFKDGTRFNWDTGRKRDSLKVIQMQRARGDPVEIIGSGYTANYLRDKYAGKDVKFSVGQLTTAAVGHPIKDIEDKYDAVVDKIKKKVGLGDKQ